MPNSEAASIEMEQLNENLLQGLSEMLVDDASPSDISEHTFFDQDAIPPSETSQRASVKEVPDEEMSPRYAEPCSPSLGAGASYGRKKTTFDIIRDEQVLRGAEIWGPFQNDAEWELAKWLIKNVGHNQAEEFLKLAVVRQFDCTMQRYLLHLLSDS